MQNPLSVLVLMALAAGCGGGTELGGAGGANGAGGAKTTVEKKADPEAEDPDEVVTTAEPSANVAGAFLVECGPALADAGGAAASGLGWFGCGGFDASGAKSTARRITKLKLALTNGSTLETATSAASGKSRYAVVAALATAQLAIVRSVDLELDDGTKRSGKIVAAEVPDATTADQPGKLEVTCDKPHEVKLKTGVCETMVLIRQFRRIDGRSYDYVVDGGAAAADFADNGAYFYALRPRPECPPGSCGLSETNAMLTDDGTIPIFLWGVKTSGAATALVGHGMEHLHNASIGLYDASFPLHQAFRGWPSALGVNGAATALLLRFAPVGLNFPVAAAFADGVRGPGAVAMDVSQPLFLYVERAN